jgi:glycyl-tRNA synthetase beta chain
MSRLLIEISSEDMPAKNQVKQGLKFRDLVAQNLKLEQSRIELMISARHLALYVENFALEEKIFIKGPKITAPDSATQGFINRYKIAVDNLIIKDTCYFYEKHLSKQESQQLLVDQIEAAFHNMVWNKSMSWGESTINWIRPIKAILGLLDDHILPIKFGDIEASNYIIANKKQIYIKEASLELYLSNLRRENVWVLQQERKNIILREIEKLLQPLRLQLINNQPLLEELIGLVENPHLYLGQIEVEFLSLPREVLLTSLAHHQKYLLVEDYDGNLAPYFIIIANIKAADGGKAIVLGQEKVLKARLKDAAFFIQEDQKNYPHHKSPELEKVIFHEKIGTLSEKVDSTKNLLRTILIQLKLELPWLEKAANLCKNDLVTNLVCEFPELQGIVGYYYCKLQGIQEEVALAIRDHYKPMGVNDSLPATLGGALLAIADKLDSLISFFGADIKPTATKDPFALRRAALGILRIKNHFNLQINIPALVEVNLLHFIEERAKQANLQL